MAERPLLLDSWCVRVLATAVNTLRYLDAEFGTVRMMEWTLQNGAMDLPAALAAYDRVAQNLEKLDRLWIRMSELLPDGPFLGAGSDDELAYTQLGEEWAVVASSLPAIKGWKLEAEIFDYASIGQARLGYLDIGEHEQLRAFDARVSAPQVEPPRV